MTKQTKRKGFTAIEMLIVIAIIAGLVAVVIPVVGNQTIKSKAAANAANLRTIESAVSLKMVENPDAFEAYFQDGGGHKEISESALGKIYDFFFGEGESGELADKYLLQYADTNTDGTTISINGTSPVVTIPGVALARVMEAPRRDGSTGLVINPGADEYMSVYISEEGVLAFYGNYTKEDFADVAQDGYYDGSVSAGSGGNSGGIQGWIETGVCKLQGKHAPGPGCKCLTCGEVAHLDADKGTLQNYNSSTTLHECRCGEVFISGHIYEGNDHACKYKKNYKEACPEVSTCKDTDPEDNGIIFGDKEDHVCYLCNEYKKEWCSDEDNPQWFNDTPDHYCDLSACNQRLTNCGDEGYTKVDSLQHECNICEAKTNHSYGNSNTCACGYSKPTCNYTKDGVRCTNTEIVESDGDKGYCATHKLKDCTAKVKVLGVTTTCGNRLIDKGQYRGTIADCNQAGDHLKCGVCQTTSVQNNGYCDAHQEKTCKEPVLKSSGGTQNCNTKYRDTCGNAANHHTTHTYVEVPTDAVKHKCACGVTENHNYVNGSCTVCGRSSHSAPNDCVDDNKDHNCDVSDCTNTTMGGTHTTTTNLNNGYHGCSYCSKDKVACSDENKDHKCDTCGYTMSTCTDSSPKDHACDYGCGSSVGTHTTTSSKTTGTNGTHGCSYCTYTVSCTDGDKNHKCDANCGNNSMGTHHYYNYGNNDNHKCDYCGTQGHNYGWDNYCDTCGYEKDSCVTPDTLITLADGTKKRVDQLTGYEELLVWNLETGEYDSAPIMFIDSEAECEVEVIYLHFSDGTLVKVITEHGFWDYTLNMYVYLDHGAEAYIGHTFFKQSENGGEKVELVDVEFKTEVTTAWSPVTVGHLCYFVNDMLSMPGGIGGLLNIFDVDPETMAYDYEAMARDIETYGLLTYEELASILPLSEDMFNAAGGAYLNISIGKGNMTEEELIEMIQRYSIYFE